MVSLGNITVKQPTVFLMSSQYICIFIWKGDYTFTGLEKAIDAALGSMTVQLIRKYFRKVREYQRAYREGNMVGKEMQNIYKSHRRVLELTT